MRIKLPRQPFHPSTASLLAALLLGEGGDGCVDLSCHSPRLGHFILVGQVEDALARRNQSIQRGGGSL